jgi:hypothetical protein
MNKLLYFCGMKKIKRQNFAEMEIDNAQGKNVFFLINDFCMNNFCNFAFE